MLSGFGLRSIKVPMNREYRKIAAQISRSTLLKADQPRLADLICDINDAISRNPFRKAIPGRYDR
jgi:hypothetical protein